MFQQFHPDQISTQGINLCFDQVCRDIDYPAIVDILFFNHTHFTNNVIPNRRYHC